MRAQSDDAQPDFIEGLVGRLFGKKALEDPTPGGLKRMTLEEQPEIYKATTDVFAALLESDEGLVRVIRPLLARTQLEKTPLRLAYDANRDGWTGKAFHAKVDSFGAAVVLAKTERGAWIGGYNPKVSGGRFVYTLCFADCCVQSRRGTPRVVDADALIILFAFF